MARKNRATQTAASVNGKGAAGRGPGPDELEEAMLLTRYELALMFGVTTTAITNWMRKGLPVTDLYTESDARLYNARAVLLWYKEKILDIPDPDSNVARKTEISKADVRVKALRADKLEMELKHKAGQLVPVQAAVELLTNRIASAQAKLLSLPTRIAPRVVRLNTAKAVEKEAQLVVAEALAELSEFNDSELSA